MRILVINVRTFGDMVLHLPFLQSLRDRHPDARITLLTGRRGSEVLRAAGLQIEVKPIRELGWRDWLRLRGADQCYVFFPFLKGALMAWLLGARERIGFCQTTGVKFDGTGFPVMRGVSRWKEWLARRLLHRPAVRELREEHESRTDFQLLEEPAPEMSLRGLGSADPRDRDPEGGTVVFFPSASARIKEWPLQNWRILAQRLLEKDLHVERIVVLGEGDRRACFSAMFSGISGVEILAGRTGIADVFQRVRGADLVVANDSLGIHVASFYDRPTIGLFGPNRPEWFGALGTGSVNLSHRLSCYPCRQPAGKERCLRGYVTCPSLGMIEADEVFSAAGKILTGSEVALAK